MSTKQQQIDEFKQKKAVYDTASSPEAKKAVIAEYNAPKTPEGNFKASEQQTTAQNTANQAKDRVNTLTGKDSLVSQQTYDVLNSSFAKPTAVVQADAYINTQLQKIQSGKTSYSDQVKDMIAQIQGRDKFSYDVDNDPLFQQALASAMGSGKQAMQDTIGQASALTGGYGSSYATTAGNQAYNSFIEDAYDNLPQYYQMALEAYQMEGDEMYRQLGMLNEADATEYNRNITAYDATYQHRNQMYNEAYQQFRDTKTDALNMANLKLSEHGQLVSDAVNNYNVNADYADTLYNREYQAWTDQIDNAWKQINYDRGVFESDRAYNRDVFESDRNYNRDVFESDRAYDENVRQYNDSRYWDNYWNKQDQKNWEAQQSQSQQNWEKEYAMDVNAYKVSTGDMDANGILSKTEMDKNAKIAQMNGGGSGNTKREAPKYVVDKISTLNSNEDIDLYLSNLAASGAISMDEAKEWSAMYSVTPLKARNWTVSYNGGNNGNGGIDNNARVKDENGREYRLDQLVGELVKEGMSKEEATEYVKNLQKNLGIVK